MTALVKAYPHATDRRLSEIRMLGPLQVHRVDGSVVDSREWRTGKTADLLRLLALRAGQPVPVNALVAALWPNSDHRRGHASLRTAASQIRHILDRGCLERSPAGLQLRDVWVDVVAFRELAAQAQRLMSTGELSSVATIAREADALYRGDLRAHDDGADWVLTERRTLANTYQILLCDAAEAAVTRGFARDAVDFASRAVAMDPFGERASRLLMRGYAELGEISLGLREFERCRVLLAEELGVDPSPQTRAVHLQLLRIERPIQAARNAQPHLHSAQPLSATDAEVACLGDPEIQAESRLQLALAVCIPARQFVRARRCAQEAASLTDLPAVRARAIVASCLPEVLLGRPRAAAALVEQAAALAAESGDRLLQRRLDVLRCLVAHDLASPDFEAHWTHAAASCEVETDVNWAWLMIRVATERGDLVTAQLANRLPVAPGSGALARQLHMLASAELLGELGEFDQAADRLRGVIDAAGSSRSTLLLPEALSRLIMLQAPRDLRSAEENFAQLDRTLGHQSGLPREAFLRLMAGAAIQSAHGRAAAAATAAASAAEVAEDNGLRFLAASAHELCAQYTARAQALSARGARHAVSRLALTLSNAAG